MPPSILYLCCGWASIAVYWILCFMLNWACVHCVNLWLLFMTVHGFAKLRPSSYKCNLFAASAAPAGRAWTTLPLELGYARITNYISCRWTAHESPPYSLLSRLQRRPLGSGLPTPQPPKLRDLSILFYSVQDPRPRLQVSLLLFFSKYKKN